MPRLLSLALLLALLGACERHAPPMTAPAEPLMAASAPAPAAAVQRVEGIDLSHYQGADVDLAGALAAGKRFVFIKTTQGATLADPDYARNMRQARAAGLLVGGYHFYDALATLAAQFRNFTAQLQLLPGDLPPVVDIEQLGRASASSVATELQQFLEMLERQYGVRPILYSGEAFAAEYLSGFGAYLLWVAEYSAKDSPRLPKGWVRWTFWQYSQAGQLVGLAGPVDLNRFNGSEAELERLRVK